MSVAEQILRLTKSKILHLYNVKGDEDNLPCGWFNQLKSFELENNFFFLTVKRTTGLCVSLQRNFAWDDQCTACAACAKPQECKGVDGSGLMHFKRLQTSLATLIGCYVLSSFSRVFCADN